MSVLILIFLSLLFGVSVFFSMRASIRADKKKFEYYQCLLTRLEEVL